MKLRIKKLLQSILGLDNYLFLFGIFKIWTLKWDRVEGEFMAFLPLVPDDGLILDIGANIGIMTVLLAKHAPRSQVHAFEPMPVNFNALQRVTSWFKLKNVVLHHEAIGNENTQVEMIMPVVDSVRLQGLSYVVTGDMPTAETGDKVAVQCRRLDDIAAFSSGKRVVAMKIDVQGFEYFVLEGARSLLEHHKPVIYCEMGADQNDLKARALFGAFGYQLMVYENGSLVSFDPQIHTHHWNFFVIPPQ